MRRLLSPLSFFSILLVSQSISAQMIEKQPEQGVSKGNIIKMNLSALVFKNFSFQYERVLGPKTSLGLGFAIMPKTGLPFASTLKDQYGSNGDAARAIDETQLSNISITPEFRWYLGKKKAPNGFYIAPFARYAQMKFDQVYRFTPADNRQHVANIKGTINNIGGGLLIGAQWNLSKSLTLDWWIAGPVYGSSNGTLIGTDPIDIPQQSWASIEQDIENTDIPGTELQATVTKNNINVEMSGPYVGLRAFGLALGIRF